MTPLPNEPTPERRARSHFVNSPAIGTEMAQAKAGQRMFRAVPPIERMRRDGSLSTRQAEAGERLRDDYELGVAGARDSVGGHSGSVQGYYYTERRLDALHSYARAEAVLGPRLCAVVVPICTGWLAGGDITVSQLARVRGANRQEVAGQLKLGLDMLADHYGLA